ncbi:MAG: DUF624 domain-containing protein [Bacteroidales bacterium]|nr:DUF624 domain-containing protein [Bacteroidales bacterium]
MEKLTNLFFLSLCWLLCSLPFVTIGASTVALFSFTLKQVDDTEGYPFRSFFRAFKTNFRQATILWLLFLAGCAFFFLDYYALFRFAWPSVFQILIFALVTCLCFLFVVLFCYAFPLLACFKLSVPKILRDAVVMGMQHIMVTLLVFVVYGVFGWISFRFPYLSPLWIAVALFISSYLFQPVFRSYLTS